MLLLEACDRTEHRAGICLSFDDRSVKECMPCEASSTNMAPGLHFLSLNLTPSLLLKCKCSMNWNKTGTKLPVMGLYKKNKFLCLVPISLAIARRQALLFRPGILEVHQEAKAALLQSESPY